jgi:fused signal recognition particle receptor
MGLFDAFKQALKKTSDILNTDIRDLFKREGRLVDEDFLRDLYAMLVKTDMGTSPAGKIRDKVATDFRARVVHMDDVLKVVKAELKQLVAQPEAPIKYAANGPTVVLVVGVNGSGKTTSIAKLMHLFHQQGKQVVVGAGDTFRAAAVDQLTIWAEREQAEIVKGQPGSDPAAVAHRAVARAIESGADVCIIDTAGRLQTQTNLMQQLEKIYRVMGKLIPEAPHEVLLVVDATAGQNALSQAQGFSQAARCTGIFLAKLDGTAKGGVVIPIRERFAIPVKFVGVGEKAGDIEVFRAEEFVDALFAGVPRAA